MTPQELAKMLKELDRLYVLKSTFRDWLARNTETSDTYEQVRAAIENAFPSLHVVYVDVTYKQTHALVASD